MKNKILILFLTFFLSTTVLADNLEIQSSTVTIDKKSKLTIFKGNVVVMDAKKNKFSTNYAEYNKELKLLVSKGKTNIITSEGFSLTGTDMIFDNQNKIIRSNNDVLINDLENNQIFLEKFEYSTKNNFFRSTGNIKLIDSRDNAYNFSQIYIDEKKREIIGTDIKSYINESGFKLDERNSPRIFANSVKIEDQKTNFDKAVFTMCGYRSNDKCPPWSMQASGMLHDKKKKTIYYDNAVVKVYDFPVFYFPKISHPDPSVKRRSGFLLPTFTNSKNLGAGFQIPYFFDLGGDKDFTFTPKTFVSETPLFLGEYRQAFKKSKLILDFSAGEKSHQFLQFVKNFTGKDGSKNDLRFSLQQISHDKTLKLYKINTSLANKELDMLENYLSFTRDNENFFLSVNATVFETLKQEGTYSDKYEYVLPDVILNKNLFSSSKFGNAEMTSHLNFHNFDTNKFANFFMNDLDWRSNNFVNNKFINGRFLGKIRNINYDAKNISDYKTKSTHELYGALGYLAEVDFLKEKNNNSHYLTPKVLLRYAPDHMRKQKIDDGNTIDSSTVFSLDRLGAYNSFEAGANATLGFDYKFKNLDKEFDLSVGQIINEKENKNMPSTTSLDEKLSDLVGSANLQINENLNFNYDFAVDQNYRDINLSDFGMNYTLGTLKFNFNYLQTNKHIGDEDYFTTEIAFNNKEKSLFALKTKRNLITNSAEYYNLSYEYMNDCLKAGIVYRREFYEDSELEPENSLMFKITLVPFGRIDSPELVQ